jgi:catechol 1,2-dioxygenase
MDDTVKQTIRAMKKDVAGTDPAIQERMAIVLQRLHALVDELRLTTPELMGVIHYLTDVAKNDELILLSDVLGISVHVNDLTHPHRPGATPASVEGPFYREGAPSIQVGRLADATEPGDPLIVTGQVKDATTGKPLAGAIVDVWHTDHRGSYSYEDPQKKDYKLRGKLVTDSDGRYVLRTILPVPYEIGKNDGPVGILLRRLGRHRTRPAHPHFIITCKGYRPLTTMLFFEGDPYLDSDPIFAPTDGLIVKLARHDDPQELKQHGMPKPFWSFNFDFALVPA